MFWNNNRRNIYWNQIWIFIRSTIRIQLHSLPPNLPPPPLIFTNPGSGSCQNNQPGSSSRCRCYRSGIPVPLCHFICHISGIIIFIISIPWIGSRQIFGGGTYPFLPSICAPLPLLISLFFCSLTPPPSPLYLFLPFLVTIMTLIVYWQHQPIHTMLHKSWTPQCLCWTH